MRLRLMTVECGKSGGRDCDNGIGGGCAFARRLSDGAGMDSIRSAIKTIPGS